MKRRLAGFAVALAVAALAPLATASQPASADPRALVETLNVRLLASDSATLTLEAWCGERGLAEAPVVTAELDRGAARPATPEVRARLRVEPDAPVRYRKVRLVCGGRTLSVAENWYVPARLTAPMNAALETTRAPFGKVVRPLQPRRETFAVERPPAQEPGSGDVVLVHRALVVSAAGEPLALVVENYTASLIPPATAP